MCVLGEAMVWQYRSAVLSLKSSQAQRPGDHGMESGHLSLRSLREGSG